MNKKKLCVFTIYAEKGASSQYRTYIFRDEFEKKYDVKWYSFWNNKYVTKYMHNKKKYIIQISIQYLVSAIKRWFQLRFIAPKCDIVFVQKAIIPKMKKTYLNRIKNKKIKIVFDVDDAVYVDRRDNSNQIAKFADVVICGNQTLKNYYSTYNKNCIVIPTVDNTYKYKPYWKDTFDSKIIGWIGSKTTINNFDVIIKSLNTITKKHPEVKIAIISNTALNYTDKINNSYLVPWKKETYIEEIGKFTIGIMPLKSNEFTVGKCGFKLIQYLNMKKPVIGSDVGVNKEIIDGNGIVANTEEEWINAIETLLFDRNKYNECVQHIEENFFETYHFKKISKDLMNNLEIKKYQKG